MSKRSVSLAICIDCYIYRFILGLSGFYLEGYSRNCGILFQRAPHKQTSLVREPIDVSPLPPFTFNSVKS